MFVVEALAIIRYNDCTDLVIDTQRFQSGKDVVDCIIKNYQDLKSLVDEGSIQNYSLTHHTTII